MMRIGAVYTLLGVLAAMSVSPSRAEDWLQFRGPGLSGRSPENTLPTKWGDSENLRWKSKLPGPGSSSPIVVGKRVFVTSYSGYGVGASSGEQKNLRRHLVCVDAESGKELWSKSVAPVLPEDNFRGFLVQHGYPGPPMAQLMLFGMRAIAGRSAGPTWEELQATMCVCFLFRGLSAANFGGHPG